MHTRDVLTMLRHEFEEKLKSGGFSWNKDGVMGAFDRAMAAALLRTMEGRNGQVG